MRIANIQQSKDVTDDALSTKLIVNFPSLEQETRSHVDTACAAFHLMRKPQTLRTYACFETGSIRPIRINGRLAWPVAEIRKLLNGGV
ncbi:DNA-binding protein [Undibacterium sp. Ji42W]|uniref:DNA-binding protein n=1 Tax=Undibacterium sp. Ji42W TaxID=3413039 RepID=UPI003BF29BE7